MERWGDRRTDEQERLDEMLLDEDAFNARFFGRQFVDVKEILQEDGNEFRPEQDHHRDSALRDSPRHELG
jgi:hypothetical protein